MSEEKKRSSAKSDKAKCEMCGYEEHILVEHIKKKHSLDPVEYLDKHPGAALWSSTGWTHILKYNSSNPKIAMTPRPRKKVQLAKLLPDLYVTSKRKPVGEVEIFDTPGPLTPKLNESYVFPDGVTEDVLTILEKPKRNSIYMQGWSGVGKTEFVKCLAAKCNAELMEYNADSMQGRSTIIGHYVVRDGATVWQDGVLPMAMKRGTWLLVNEWDTMDPHTTNMFKPVLEDKPHLYINETSDIVQAHPDFRMFAACNTWSRGDATGLFSNTLVQSDADLRRWSARVFMDYPSEAVEVSILKRYFGDDLEDDEPGSFVTVVNRARDAFKSSKIDKTFSTGELINWVENFLICGKGPHHAARLSFLNSCAPDVQVSLIEMINAAFGPESGAVSSVEDDEEDDDDAL